MKVLYCKRFDLDLYWNEWVVYKKRSFGLMTVYEFGPFMLTIHGVYL